MIPQKLEGPTYIACEGGGDAEFIRRLLAHHGLTGFDVGHSAGRDNLERHLLAVTTETSITKIRNLIVVFDNEDSPQDAAKLVKTAFNAIGYQAPDPPNILKGNPFNIGAFLIPATGKPGGIEHLILDSIFDDQPDLKPCVQKFMECTKHVLNWPNNPQGKMMLQALLSTHCQDNPGTTLSHAWDSDRKWCPDGKHLIPLSSDRFSPLLNFLKSLA